MCEYDEEKPGSMVLSRMGRPRVPAEGVWVGSDMLQEQTDQNLRDTNQRSLILTHEPGPPQVSRNLLAVPSLWVMQMTLSSCRTQFSVVRRGRGVWKFAHQYLHEYVTSTHILLVKVSHMVVGRGGKANAMWTWEEESRDLSDENAWPLPVGRAWHVLVSFCA